MKKLIVILALFAALAMPLHAGVLQRGQVRLICHRTSNRDVPENTLESLAYAARMGCNIVELDIRTTLDGVLVLHHDGYLERVTEAMGDVELTSFDELQLYDAGGWMSSRFSPMRIPRLTDALRLAHQQGIDLHLDIKQPGEAPAIVAALRSEGMLDHVLFDGESHNADDLRALLPTANADILAWLGPGVSSAQVSAAHAQGKFVIANFSANAHEMDLPAMRAAVAAGVDAINVDYPRLGADAVGRPVETRLAVLIADASTGPSPERTTAIRELSKFTGFPTQSLFVRWLSDPDAQVSRAAAVALVLARPGTPPHIFIDALTSPQSSTRRNAAWALGVTHAQATVPLQQLLHANDPVELKEVLLAISRCPGSVSATAILPLIDHAVPTVRAAAALALSAHHPELAAHAVPRLLRREEQRSASAYLAYVQRGKPPLTQLEIDPIIEQYREHIKLIHALELLPPKQALPLLATEAFRSAEDSSHVTSLLAGYALWDRIGSRPSLAIAQLDAPDIEVADRAEWVLTQAGPAVLPAMRAALVHAAPAVRRRLIRILALQGDVSAIPVLTLLQTSDSDDHDLLTWAMQKIRMLQLQP